MRTAPRLAFFAPLLLLACTSGPEPAPAPAPVQSPGWLADHPQDPQFPTDAYLVGLGGAKVEGDLAKAREQAVGGARADLSRGIRTRIRSVLETFENTLARSGLVRQTSEFTQKIESATDLDLPGVEVVRQWHDEAQDYLHVKVAVHRGRFAATLAREAQEGLSAAQGLTPLAPREPAGRLRALLGAFSELTRASGKLAILQVVAPGSRPELHSLLGEHLPAVTNALLELLDTIRLTVISGANQEGFSGGRLPEPILVEATAGGTPLANVPLEFLPPAPEAARVVPAQGGITDAAGRVSLELTELKLTGLTENSLVIRLALARFAPEWPSGQGPAAVALYILPTLQSARFALALEEVNLERPTAEPVTAGRISGMLAAKGVRLIALDRIDPAWRSAAFLELPVAEIRRRLAGQVDYLVRGRLRTVAAERTAQGICFAYAGGTVEMIDIRRGDLAARVDLSADRRIKGGDRSFEQAGLRALRSLADQATTELEARLSALFPR